DEVGGSVYVHEGIPIGRERGGVERIVCRRAIDQLDGGLKCTSNHRPIGDHHIDRRIHRRGYGVYVAANIDRDIIFKVLRRHEATWQEQALYGPRVAADVHDGAAAVEDRVSDAVRRWR